MTGQLSLIQAEWFPIGLNEGGSVIALDSAPSLRYNKTATALQSLTHSANINYQTNNGPVPTLHPTHLLSL